MQKYVYAILITLLMMICATLLVSAQDATPEPTSEMTAEPTVEATMEATVEATAESTAQPGAESTPEAEVMPEVEAPPSDNNAYLRVAHFSPDAPTVDVYFNDVLAIKGLNYLAASRWISVIPASYTVAVVASGDPVTTAVVSFDVSASAGTWQTVAIVGSADHSTLQGAVIAEDYSDLLPGTGGFTFFNALEGGPAVNLVRNDIVYYAQIGFPGPNTAASSSSLRDDTGTFNVKLVPSDDETTILFEQPNLEIRENAYTLLALVGTPNNPSLVEIVTDESEVEMVRGLLPRPGTLIEALRANDNLSGFADALAGSDLLETLSDPDAEYTIFAPASFVMDDTNVSAAALNGYIVEGKYTSNDLANGATFTALDGSTLTVTTADNGIYVNGVLVIDVNIAATNGVIHMLNAAFTPPA